MMMALLAAYVLHFILSDIFFLQRFKMMVVIEKYPGHITKIKRIKLIDFLW